MLFSCLVCGKSFSRAQDRSTHVRFKKDDPHRQYLQEQQQNLMRHFSATMEAASAVPVRAPAIQNVLVQMNDVDQDDLPSSWDMDVDSPSKQYSDDEHGIISDPEVLVGGNDEYEDAEDLTQAAALGGFNLDDIPEAFDFLPDPELDVAEGEANPGISDTAYQRTRRTLIDIEGEQPVYKWHPNAGQVYGHEPLVHARWQALFHAGPESQPYEPFRSRVDWEMAQWAVKEKIPQKSFDRLLKIPQVFCTNSHTGSLFHTPRSEIN